jgi:acetyl esterase/lipase
VACDGCVSAYTWLVGSGGVDPDSLSVVGDSAGGNLALAVTVAARDRQLPLPARVAITGHRYAIAGERRLKVGSDSSAGDAI